MKLICSVAERRAVAEGLTEQNWTSSHSQGISQAVLVLDQGSQFNPVHVYDRERERFTSSLVLNY